MEYPSVSSWRGQVGVGMSGFRPVIQPSALIYQTLCQPMAGIRVIHVCLLGSWFCSSKLEHTCATCTLVFFFLLLPFLQTERKKGKQSSILLRVAAIMPLEAESLSCSPESHSTWTLRLLPFVNVRKKPGRRLTFSKWSPW